MVSLKSYQTWLEPVELPPQQQEMPLAVVHGQPVLQWFDASLGPPRARRFDFALGA